MPVMATIWKVSTLLLGNLQHGILMSHRYYKHFLHPPLWESVTLFLLITVYFFVCFLPFTFFTCGFVLQASVALHSPSWFLNSLRFSRYTSVTFWYQSHFIIHRNQVICLTPLHASFEQLLQHPGSRSSQPVGNVRDAIKDTLCHISCSLGRPTKPCD